MDANQYHVRGILRFETTASGDVFLEFTSSFLLGSRLEDFFCSLLGDTLRIVDRERGRMLEGLAAEEFLRDELSMDFGVRQALLLALGGRPRCEDIDHVEVRGDSGGRVVSGRVGDESFRTEFDSEHRVGQVDWPVPGDRTLKDRLRVDYEWKVSDGGRAELKRMVIRLEEREWRCKLVSTTM